MSTTIALYPIEWDPSMDDVGGIGGTHEEGCRAMVLAAARYLNGRTTPLVGKKHRQRVLKAVLLRACDDCTGWMFGAAINHASYIAAHGWPEYVEHMRQRKLDDHDP